MAKKQAIPLIVAAVFLAAMAAVVAYLKRDTRLILSIDGKSLRVEVADTVEERSRGLMYRDGLEDGSGMLFVYPDEEYRTFWMHNTRLPLSIAFIRAEGSISQVEDMKPFDTTGVKSIERVMYALEVPRGWFRKVGIGVGDKIEIPQGVVGK